MGTAGLRGGGHRGARRRTQACPRRRSAVRRRPSLPRPVRVGTARPPSAATSGSVPSYTGRPGHPQPASEQIAPPGPGEVGWVRGPSGAAAGQVAVGCASGGRER
ncbi:predicted protein [Streptomyces viridochromogenes DSM 40736]|uniref:Predicted protein n=1 Tax=Streptomyces viridochromogenes (strain DSM 40736 / JCM 4977 / BCRC 1201 / Tue 494) TaxID=591159 RepID=D9XDZ8_STRVT|nr:predicted protein [Streptomyces viridochromogenes DSM 40736]